MQPGHMVFDSEPYQGTLSGQAVKVNSWIIYTRLVKRLAPITHTHTPGGEDSLLSYKKRMHKVERRRRNRRNGEEECVIWCQLIKDCGSQPLGFW